MDKVRGKFTVTGVKKDSGSQGSQVTLESVGVSDKEKSENNMYHKYTPSGNISMYIDNPSAEQFFTQGKTVYVDFSEAPAQ